MSDLSETPFRVYRLDDVDMEPDTPSFLGAADSVSLGDLLLDQHKRGRIGKGVRVGIMYRPIDGRPGEWIVPPWRA